MLDATNNNGLNNIINLGCYLQVGKYLGLFCITLNVIVTNYIYIIFAGKAALITVGGLVVGAVIGSTIESWLQVDVVPIFGIRSPAVIISEFILFSQLVTSLYLR